MLSLLSDGSVFGDGVLPAGPRRLNVKRSPGVRNVGAFAFLGFPAKIARTPGLVAPEDIGTADDGRRCCIFRGDVFENESIGSDPDGRHVALIDRDDAPSFAATGSAGELGRRNQARFLRLLRL